jgi:hypothetical protein
LDENLLQPFARLFAKKSLTPRKDELLLRHAHTVTRAILAYDFAALWGGTFTCVPEVVLS